MNKRTEEQTNRRTDEQTNRQTDEHISRGTDEETKINRTTSFSKTRNINERNKVDHYSSCQHVLIDV